MGKLAIPPELRALAPRGDDRRNGSPLLVPVEPWRLEVDYTHPLARGLIAVLVPADAGHATGSARLVDITKQRTVTIDGSPGTTETRGIGRTVYLAQDSVTEGYRIGTINPNNEYAYGLYAEIVTINSSRRQFLAGQFAADLSGSYEMGGPYFGSSGQAYFYYKNGSNITVPGNYATGDLMRFIGSYQGGGAGALMMTERGFVTQSGSGGTNTIPFRVGGRWFGGSTLAPRARIAIVPVWNRYLTPGEAQLWVDNPYCFLRPANQSPFLHVVSAGGGAFAGTFAASASVGAEALGTYTAPAYAGAVAVPVPVAVESVGAYAAPAFAGQFGAAAPVSFAAAGAYTGPAFAGLFAAPAGVSVESAATYTAPAYAGAVAVPVPVAAECVGTYGGTAFVGQFGAAAPVSFAAAGAYTGPAFAGVFAAPAGVSVEFTGTYTGTGFAGQFGAAAPVSVGIVASYTAPAYAGAFSVSASVSAEFAGALLGVFSGTFSATVVAFCDFSAEFQAAQLAFESDGYALVAIEALYDSELAIPGVYAPLSGPAVSTRVVHDREPDDYGEAFDSQMRRIRRYLCVQRIKVQKPKRGDTVILEGGEVLEVRDVRPKNSYEWRLEVMP